MIGQFINVVTGPISAGVTGINSSAGSGLTSLLDPMALVREDADAEGEARWVIVGLSVHARLLTVVYTLRGEDRIRLISARKATRKLAEYYA